MVNASPFDDEGHAFVRPTSGSSQRSARSDRSNEEEDRLPSPRKEFSRYIVLDYAENGDLFDFVITPQEALGEDISRAYFQQLISAIEYLHVDQRIIHRDLKLENILVDANFNLKVCDFTLAKTISEGSMVGVFYTHAGTERYMAPEIIEGKPYKGSSTDIFALGVVLFVMVTGVMPFLNKAEKSDALYQFIYKNDEKGFWEALNRTYQGVSGFNQNLTDDFKKFVWQFFNYHYFERINLDKIKQAKWFQGEIPAKEDINREMARRKHKLAGEKSKQSPSNA